MKIYSKEEVVKSTLEYFKGDDLATNVWISKYALKDKNGELLELNPDMMHKRLAKEVARIEQKYFNPMSENEIYELLKDFKYFVFGGSSAFGIGNENFVSSLGNCFVIGNVSDSYGGILIDDYEMVQIFKRRGGCGLDLSHLRPKKSITNNAALFSTGAVSFAERYSYSTREVAQGGRRGALMLSISIKHPDSDEFVSCKKDKTKITGANISVKIDKEFIEAVKNNTDYFQTFPIDLNINNHTAFCAKLDEGNIEYNKLYDLQYRNDNEYKGCYVKKIKARELWNKIIHHATIDAEPGLLFWDKILKESIPSCYGKEWIELSTNPCSELPLNPYDSCRLSSLNLYSYVTFPFENITMFNWELFKDNIQKGQRIMDDIVDLEEEKINKIIEKINNDTESDYIKQTELNLWIKIKEKLLQGRRTGFGITGEGDMLAALGLKYGTKEATEFAIKVHKIFAVEAYKSSIQLAKERGCFSIWSLGKESNNPFINRILNALNEGYEIEKGQENPIVWDYEKYGRRNIACLTIAPNGTLSLMTQTSSGIEPVFEVYYKRRRKSNEGTIIDEVGDKWEEYKVFHPKFVEWYKIKAKELNVKEFNSIEEALEKLKKADEKDIKDLILLSPYYKATANEIDYLEKVEMQGQIQKWIDHSISVTHNLPKGISEEEVSKIYMKAYEVGCKGVTVYVDGSRSGVLIKDEKKNYERPESLSCDIYVVKVKGNDWIVLIGLNNNVPYEVFAFKQGNLQITHDLPNAQLIKRKLKNKNYYDLIANSHFRLNDIASFFELGEEQSLTRQISLNLRYGVVPIDEIIDQLEKATGSVVELSKALLRVLKKYVKDNSNSGNKCPECGEELIYNSGCVSCVCGYSKC